MSSFFLDPEQIRRFNYTIIEARLEDLRTEAGARRFLSDLPGSCTIDESSLQDLLYNQHIDVVKEPVSPELASTSITPARCEVLRRNHALIADYQARARASDLTLPALPSAVADEKTRSECPMDMNAQCQSAARSTGLDLHLHLDPWAGRLQILSPAYGLTVPWDDGSAIECSFALHLPLEVKRARMHEERHWVMNYRVSSVVRDGAPGDVLWESWLDDEILVRRAGVNWAQARAPERFRLPPLSTLVATALSKQENNAPRWTQLELEVAVSIFKFDVDDLRYPGRGNRTIKRGMLALVTSDNTRFYITRSPVVVIADSTRTLGEILADGDPTTAAF